jgi:hypothetical protein
MTTPKRSRQDQWVHGLALVILAFAQSGCGGASRPALDDAAITDAGGKDSGAGNTDGATAGSVDGGSGGCPKCPQVYAAELAGDRETMKHICISSLAVWSTLAGCLNDRCMNECHPNGAPLPACSTCAEKPDAMRGCADELASCMMDR